MQADSILRVDSCYAPVLGSHGWGDLQPELNKLSKMGNWDEMGSLITDEIHEFAVVGELDQVVASSKVDILALSIGPWDLFLRATMSTRKNYCET